MLIFVAVLGVVFYGYSKIYLSKGDAIETVTVSIERGDNALVVGDKLVNAKVITNKYLLAFYLWRKGELHSIVAGVYEFVPGVKIPEVARIITGGEVASTRVPVTFPEGWTVKDMAARLSANNLPGDEFLALVNAPTQDLKDEFPFLKELSNGQSLEGYLFPDTYYFAKDATAHDIVEKMLKDFSQKVPLEMRSEAVVSHQSLFDVITMASIVEGEVRSDADRAVVAGIFWNRIAHGQALQSDATLEYVLQTKALQHSIQETKTASPYNTYANKGLPPGPVGNPGISSILAALRPTQTSYNYFLTDPKTGNTAFAATYAEHLANKQKYGL